MPPIVISKYDVHRVMARHMLPLLKELPPSLNLTPNTVLERMIFHLGNETSPVMYKAEMGDAQIARAITSVTAQIPSRCGSDVKLVTGFMAEILQAEKASPGMVLAAVPDGPQRLKITQDGGSRKTFEDYGYRRGFDSGRGGGTAPVNCRMPPALTLCFPVSPFFPDSFLKSGS